ncbi:MAG: phosphopentomutase, partial [Vicinamibacterales bacterium]
MTTFPDRVFLTVLDSVGVGELADADSYGDRGSDTLGNISRLVPLKLPALRSLGLPRVANIHGMLPIESPIGAYGRMAERSPGKDSVTGHWEIAGIILDRAFPTFPDGFPAQVIADYEQRIGRKTIGNKAASGTTIIDELGPEHVRTGFPIVYTSADSVFQIAAHEEVIPVPELYRICEIAYEMVGEGMGVGRVIARPFVGVPGAFQRTSNRHDYALPPAGTTLLDLMAKAGKSVHAIGKIRDLFAGRGVTTSVHTRNDDEGVDAIEQAIASSGPGLIFTNLVDFDAVYGHRNDAAGYAANLERFDARLARLLPTLRQR